MSALAQSNNSSSSVTAINANARIDYILRFSKHLVLVLDEFQEGYADISGQFLSALPESHNAAYLALSPKLNDIQIRCRLIEQLFSGAPFDPEQPLLANILGLSSATKNPITIVIENAHFMSLQIMYELSQLADSAKKTNREFNVVLTGEASAGKLVSANQMLFSQKVSMVSAQTGQLISSSSDIFKESSSIYTFTQFQKLTAIILLLSLASAGAIYTLYQREALSFSGLNEAFASAKQSIMSTDEFVVDKNVVSTQLIKDEPILSPAEEMTAALSATNDEILSAITNDNIGEGTVPIATPADINSVLLSENNDLEPSTINEPIAALVSESDNAMLDVLVDDIVYTPLPPVAPKESDKYYTSLDFGHVIQYITLSYTSQEQVVGLVEAFSKQHEDFRFKYYLRSINNNNMVVITSEFFADKNEARIELDTLPPELAVHSPWIKTIGAIKQEIAEFKRSQ